MITHNLGVVRQTASYTYLMNQGRIVEEGETQSLFEAPREQYTRDLIAAVPRLTGGAR
jgi:ABC-type dipeptide/oligopeptide/nickel transport system ATPase component